LLLQGFLLEQLQAFLYESHQMMEWEKEIGDRGKWLWKIPRNLNEDKVMFSLAISD